MVTVIFVVCLGIVFTALQRINNCHKKTSSPCALFEQNCEEVCVCVRELCMRDECMICVLHASIK